MEYCFFSSLLLRTPLYSPTPYKITNYALLLKSEEFQLALFLASRAFYEELEKKHFNFDALTARQKQTIKKYFNRATFRSTPFGLFSTFSMVPWTDQPESKIRVSFKTTPHLTLDFSVLQKLWEKMLKDKKAAPIQYQANQSLYFSHSDFRYYKTEVDDSDQTHFSMVAIAKNSILKKVLQRCTRGKSLEEIGLLLSKETSAEKDVVEEFLNEMVNQQILVSVQRPNITGENYTHLLLDFLANHYPATGSLKSAVDKLSCNLAGKLCSLVETSKQLQDWECIGKDKNPFYALSERSFLSGGLPLKYQQSIKDGLHCLHRLTQSPTCAELEKFKKAFISKYGTDEVSLLHVLDPQYGIGYGDFAYAQSSYSFLNAGLVDGENNARHRNDAEEDNLVMQLFNEWHFKDGSYQKNEIEITDEQLNKIKAGGKESQLPPSISVMFRISGDQVFIEQAGGCSALSLVGRFSPSKEVLEWGREMAKVEQQHNKDIIFAEIAHVCHLHSANINRRNHLRDYEIPVLTNSTMQQDQQIQLNDLVVSVVNDTVLLRSKKLRKWVIPRLSSAYNYTKSCFPAFRFLCDVQYQDLKPSFTFSLPVLFPGLRFYPRIRYKSCILQMAEWHLKASEVDFLGNNEITERCISFQKFAKANGIPRHFAYTVHDNFLVFDQDAPDDVVLFLNEVKNKESVVIKEFPFLTHNTLTTDSTGRPLIAQYVASLYLSGTVYKIKDIDKMEKPRSTRDWLYFKIYCHPLSSDEILSNHLFPLIKKLKRAGILIQWFWVRYQDPAFHLRLRIKVAQGNQGSAFACFNICLNKLNAISVVHHFQTDIYRQETDRYSAKLMGDVESVFNSSSNWVCNFLKMKSALQWSEEKVLVEAVVAAFQMLGYFGFNPNLSIEFSKAQFDTFFQEFGCPKSLKPRLEILHKKNHTYIDAQWKNKTDKNHYRFIQKDIKNLLCQFRQKKIKQVRMEKLAADIIHMHMNRLFSTEQRYFEMAVYFLLYRGLETQVHKARRV